MAHCTSEVNWLLRISGFCDSEKLSDENPWNSLKSLWDNDSIQIKVKQLLKSSKRMVSSMTTVNGLRVLYGIMAPLHMRDRSYMFTLELSTSLG
jgi:hypothetical protein